MKQVKKLFINNFNFHKKRLIKIFGDKYILVYLI